GEEVLEGPLAVVERARGARVGTEPQLGHGLLARGEAEQLGDRRRRAPRVVPRDPRQAMHRFLLDHAAPRRREQRPLPYPEQLLGRNASARGSPAGQGLAPRSAWSPLGGFRWPGGEPVQRPSTA